MDRDPFKEYIRQVEPDKRDKGYAWSTAIGLQAVDGLKPSDYLLETAVKNIDGLITLEEAGALLNSYYRENPKQNRNDRTEEAAGIYKHAGKIRDYNITKKEWVLDGASVVYGSASELRATLEYDLSEEKAFSYKGLNIEEMIRHLAVFVSRLWQIHAFAEGNTRTTAVFFIKYIRTLGFEVSNDIFAENAWYFRNALVKANYNDLKMGVHETTEYLELFLRNLLLGEKNELRNRDMHISGIFSKTEKADIQEEKADIQEEKADIHIKLKQRLPQITEKTLNNIILLWEKCGTTEIFGRSIVETVTGLKSSRTSELLKLLVESEIIEPVKGYGKGKYKFI